MRDKIKEYDEVGKAAENFVRTVAEGNSEHARKLFTDDAVLFGILDGELEHGSIEFPERKVRSITVTEFHSSRQSPGFLQFCVADPPILSSKFQVQQSCSIDC